VSDCLQIGRADFESRGSTLRHGLARRHELETFFAAKQKFSCILISFGYISFSYPALKRS
jgi:hypothetical protein